MCFPLTPFKIEREWTAYGFKCVVVQAREAQHRCGYVRIPPSHVDYNKEHDNIDVNIHGGLTFSQLEDCIEEDGKGYWIGFDCAHFQDAMVDPNVDISSVSEETKKLLSIYRSCSSEDSHYWTQEEVEKETEELAKQLSERS
jgi:hypothetical protein